MKNGLIFSIIILIFISCKNKSELAAEFDCDQNSSNSALKTLTDIHKNYSISIPNHWKISYYYDEYQSDIYAADTLKPLTSTYILNFSDKKGLLLLNDDFKKKIHDALSTDGLKIIRDKKLQKTEIFDYYVYSKGIRNQFPYYQIQLYKAVNKQSFFDVKIEIYGDQQVENRICEAIHYIELLQIH
ncbi:MAG: hypothetical protein Q7U08_04220 [Flavobacteriaceae bacterium]|nr:hypothetical protein [Flavobacteriaceae bacterium]